MRHLILVLAISTFFTQAAISQKYTINGKVIDQLTNETLVGANIIVKNTNDTTKIAYTLSNAEGYFSIDNLEKTTYNIKVSYLGYESYNQDVDVLFKNHSVGTIQLQSKSENIQEVTITTKAPLAIINGDTTEYVADAYKVTPDAVVEDMIKKMPGVTVEEGTVKSQGENIKKVLVDGKTFFGEDPSIALKNLPAEIVDKVQIFDEQSEQSQFTGFNDGQTSKTMNIVTRSNRRNGSFGKGTVAYGDNDRYLVNGNFNSFKNDQRTSIIVSSNNVNQQNFGSQDLLGVRGGMRGRRPGGSPGSSNSNGLSTIHSFGLNYGNTFGEKLELSGNYFFNNNNDEILQRANTEYVLNNDSSRIELSNTNSEATNYNNRLYFRINWDIDSMNSIRMNPSINFQSNSSESFVSESQGFFIESDSLTNYVSSSENYQNTEGYNISNRMTYRHKFKKDKRTFSIDQNTRLNKNEPYSTSLSNTEYLMSSFQRYTDRIITTNTEGYSFTTNMAYTEPIGKISLLQVNFRNSFSKNYSYKRTKDMDTLLSNYLQIDTLSNKYSNNYMTNSIGLSYMIQTQKLNANFSVEGQLSNLSGEQTYPQSDTTSKGFKNILPNFQLRYRVAQQKTLVVNYNTSTNAPSISQLQNVSVYSSNLTKLSIGNPNLEPEYRHNINSRIIFVNRETGSNFFFLLGSTISQNSIGNSTIYYDTIQITKPINRGTGYSLRSVANFGFRIKPIKSNLNLSSGYNVNQTPGFVNGKENIGNTQTLSQTVVLTSNISEKIDFSLSTNISYSLVNNTIASGNNDNYYSQNSRFRMNCILWKGITFEGDVSNRYYNGLSSGYNLNSTLINLGLGKKIFKKQTGEIKLTVYDLLNDNSNISRSITANQITDQEVNSLNRYVLLSFTYTFRKFGQGGQNDYRRPPGDFHGRPPGNFNGRPPHRQGGGFGPM